MFHGLRPMLPTFLTSNNRCMLSDRLRRTKLPVDALLCNNLQCSDAAQFNAVNLYAKDITDACIDAAMASIPLTCDRQASGRIPGWSEFVQPLRDKSLLWHRMWLNSDRTKTGRWLIPYGELEQHISTPLERSRRMNNLLCEYALPRRCRTTTIVIFLRNETNTW